MALQQGVSYIELRAKLDQLQRDFEKSEEMARRSRDRTTQDFDQGMTKIKSSMASAAKVAGAAIAGAVAMFAKIGFEELQEVQAVNAQTAAALKSTGGEANVTAGEIQKLAGRLQELSGVDAEVIQGGQNLLLTFTNIRNEVGKGNDIFDQATETALDMSVALGQDMKSSAIQLGKALNDPIRGITALQRVGVSFTAEQKEMIARLVEGGDAMKAQKIILAELNKEFGGSAKGYGKTLAGQIAKLRFEFEDTAATLIKTWLPTIKDTMKGLSDLANLMGEAFLVEDRHQKSLDATVSLIEQLGDSVQQGTVPMERFILNVLGMVDGLKAFSDASTLDELLADLKELQGMSTGQMSGFLTGETHPDQVREQAAAVIEVVEALQSGQPVLEETEKSGKKAGEGLKATGKGANEAKDKVADFVKVAGSEIDKWRNETIANLGTTGEEFEKLGEKATVSVDDIKGAFRSMIEAQKDFRRNFSEVARVAGKDTDDLINFMEQRFGIDAPKALKILADGTDAEVKAILRAYREWQEQASRTASHVEGEARGLKGKLKNAGVSAAQGWAAGLKSGMDLVVDAALDISNAVTREVKRNQQISSPSKVFERIGRDMDLGLAKGITDNIGEVLEAQEKLQAALERKIDKFGTVLDRLQGRLKAFKDNIRGAFSEFSVGSAFQDALSALEEGESLTAADLSAQVTSHVTNARKLAMLLNQLASLGLSSENLAQLAAMGADAIPVAEAILAGGKGSIRELNRATHAINTFADSSARDVSGKAMADVIDRIASIGNHLDKLRDRLRETNQLIRRLTNALERLDNIRSGSGGGSGGGGASAGMSGSYSNIVAVGRALQGAGYSVGEHPAFGGVNGVHTAGSYHYSGRAIDVNAGAGESAAEKAKLNALAGWLRGHVSPIAELLYPGNDANHQDHLHLAMDRGGIVRGPAMIAQGNITEAHIPLTGPGARNALAGALDGTRLRLVLDNGREFDAHIESVAANGLGRAVAGFRGM